MEEQVKRIERKNNWLLYLLIGACGLIASGFYYYSEIRQTQRELVRTVDHRFKSYDFVYFAKYHRVIPNRRKTRGKICIDTSHKDRFYSGLRKPTPFYNYMDELSCNKRK